eukprot:Nitzschia sp. Nitz4//scaffold17_size182527//110543//111403//NITZ4_001864-RA/size182527-exonerate_est2genome-gene-0.175-mRNA-1//-1//CDS//3329539370//3212//frame0
MNAIQRTVARNRIWHQSLHNISSPFGNHALVQRGFSSLATETSDESQSSFTTRKQRKQHLPAITTQPTRVRKVEAEEEDDTLPPYPKGQPWRVLWPHPHENLSASDDPDVQLKRRVPRLSDIQKGWAMYKDTWKDGLNGDSISGGIRGGDRPDEEPSALATMASDAQTRLSETDPVENATKNLNVARESAQDLLEQAKTRTGIHSQDDLKKIASEMMKLATECLREFMDGYRKGRDDEVDKMLNQYFQDVADESSTTGSSTEDSPKNARRKIKAKRPRGSWRGLRR